MTTPAKTTTAKTTAAKGAAAKTSAAKGVAKTTTAAKGGPVKVRMTFVVTLPDPGKWELADRPEVDAAPIAKALTEQGIPADVAAEMAAKTVAGANKTGINEVRTDIRAYLHEEAAKLAKVTAAGATVELVASHGN